MKVAILKIPKNIIIEDIEKPEPKAGEVRIKLSKVGICGSDVHLFMGHMLLGKLIIIGHEGLGMIGKIGANVSRKIG